MKVTTNGHGVLVGVNGGVARVAAHTYEVKANSYPQSWALGLLGTIFRLAQLVAEERTGDLGRPPAIASAIDYSVVKYLVYVKSISPKVVRCQCPDFILVGTICKHGEDALEFERLIKTLYARQYAREKRLQKEHLAAGRQRRPYSGSIQDEERL